MSEGDSAIPDGSGAADPANHGAPIDAQSTRARVRPGFAWGLAAGAVAVVAIVTVGGIVKTALMAGAFDRDRPTLIEGAGMMPSVTLSPVRAGADWFSIDASGTGVLEGWTDGAQGTGDLDVPNTIGYVDVTTIGAVDGVKVKHSASVFVTPKTKVFIGQRSVPAEDAMRDDVVGDRRLRVLFHRFGQDLVADSIRASAQAGENPMY